MNSETLFTACMNCEREYNSVVFAVKHLRRTIDRTATRVAKENAEWHDDPDADDHAAFHAPAIEQFPRSMRNDAIGGLVAHLLSELTIQEGSAE